MKRSLAHLTKLLVVLAAALAWPAAALAQEFVKVEGGPKEQIPAVPFVGIAYGFIWIAILVYVIGVARGLARVRGEMDDLRKKIDRAGS